MISCFPIFFRHSPYFAATVNCAVFSSVMTIRFSENSVLILAAHVLGLAAAGDSINPSLLMLGNSILSHFSRCIPHVIRFPSDLPLDYAKLQVPRTEYAYTDSAGNRSLLSWQMERTEKLREYLNGRYHTNAIRHFRCFLVLLSTSISQLTDEKSMFKASDLSRALRQDSVLPYGTTAGWYEGKRRPRIMPNYIVTFLATDSAEALPTFATEAVSQSVLPWLLSSLDWYEQAPIFFISKLGQNEVQYSGVYYCSFCPLQYEWHAFDSAKDASCPEAMMSTYRNSFGRNRRNVPWLYSLDFFDKFPQKTKEFCPLSLKANTSCISDDKNRVLAFLLDSSNWTLIGQVSDDDSRANYRFSSSLPRIQYKRLSALGYPADVLMTGDTASFRFVTSDNVARVGASLFGMLLTPFDIKIWLGIVTAVVVMAACITFFSSHGSQRGNAMIWNVLTIASVLIDQPVTFVDMSRLHRTFVRVANVIVITWLLVTIIVSNSYKGIMKADYVVEPKYSTQWSSIKEMNGFAFVFAMEATSADVVERTQSRLRYQMEKSCGKLDQNLYEKGCVHENEPAFWVEECQMITQVRPERHTCKFFHDFGSLKRDLRRINGTLWQLKKLKILRNIINKARIRPAEMLENVIRNELVKPHTAYVTPTNEFETDWKVFEKVMSSGRVGKHFAASKTNEHFPLNEGYVITSGYDEHFGGYVQFRAAVLMESGIYGLWQEWEQFRRIFHRPKETMKKKFVVLSLKNSDIGWPFLALLVCISCALVSLIVELIAHQMSL